MEAQLILSGRDAKREALLKSPLFQAMTPQELDETLKFAVERRYQHGSMIFQKGDEGTSLMAVLAGRVKISSVSAEGKEITLNQINAGSPGFYQPLSHLHHDHRPNTPSSPGRRRNVLHASACRLSRYAVISGMSATRSLTRATSESRRSLGPNRISRKL